MTIAVRAARIDDAPTLDGVLADAFLDDPINVHLVPDEARRDVALRRGMGHVLRHTYVPNGGAWTTDELEGVAMWGKPDDPKPSALEQLRELPAFAAAFGRRLPRAMRAFGTVEKRRPSEPHWFLDLLAVRRDRQGRGIGSALVNAGLTQAGRTDAPAFLVTSNDRNVPFYERLGFDVIEEYTIGPVRVWSMLRPAAARAS
jgi:GNAT superfamily N-acetyltransferase